MVVNRYEGLPIKISEDGKRVTKSILYPTIARSTEDIYIITTPGDRLDLLAHKYYGNVGYWWIIAQANGIGKGSFVAEPGMQIRIPADVSGIVSKFNELNS